jgi:hypothetical protein
MRKTSAILLGLGFLAAFPAWADTALNLEFAVRDLAPGAHVWLEVRPEYGQIGEPGTASDLESDAAPLVSAQGESVWDLVVPANGSASPGARMFSFPLDFDRTSAERKGMIRLKILFRIDAAAGTQKADGYPGYGQLHELTLAMPVPRGGAPLERCLRLREAGKRLFAETAANCLDLGDDVAIEPEALDSSFARSRVNSLGKPAQ